MNSMVLRRPFFTSDRVGSVFVILAFLVSCMVWYELFHPSVASIWNFDEAYYINNGRLLLQGTLPKLAESPGVTFFWAIISAPFLSEDFWMIYASSIGRVLLYALLWIGTYKIARELADLASPYFVIGLLVVTPTLVGLLENSSDALYSALSALALSHLIRAYRQGAARPLWLTAVFGTLAALTRNDGFVLFALVLLSCVVLLRRRVALHAIIVSLGTPFVIGIGAYVAVAGLVRGDIDTGIARRTYDAFEQGQGVAYHEQYRDRNPYIEGYVDSHRLYGTPEENHFSVFRAIQRNPDAFLKRVVHAAKQIPAQLTVAYGRGVRGLGVILLLLAVRGVIHLRSRREYGLLFMLALWTASLAPYFFTFFREGYFLLVFYVVFWLGSLGLSVVSANYQSKAERIGSSLALAMVTAYGVAVGNESIVWPVVILLIVLWSVWYCGHRGILGTTWEASRVATSLILLLVLSAETRLPAFSSETTPRWCMQPNLSTPRWCMQPDLPKIGASPSEQAALFLAAELPVGSNVASYSPVPVYLAKMTWFPLHSGVSVLQSTETFAAWLDGWNIEAVCVDERLEHLEPVLFGFVKDLRGNKLDLVFRDDRMTTMVLVRRHAR